MTVKHLHTLARKDVVDLACSHLGGHFPGRHSTPAIITLHGIFGARAHFKPLAKRLASDLKTDVFSVDLRNHGESPMAKPYDYLTLTKDVIHFIDTKIGPKRPVQLIGFSLGGKVGLLTSLAKNINVSGCVSIDIPPYKTPDLDTILTSNYNIIMDVMNGVEGYKIKKGSIDWKHKVLNIFKRANHQYPDGIARYFAAGFLMNPVNELSKDEFLSFKQPLHEMPDILEQIKAWPTKEAIEAAGLQYQTQTPILFCKAMKSPFITPDYSLLGVQYPNYKVALFNTTHNIAHEAGDKFYDTITTFFKEHY